MQFAAESWLVGLLAVPLVWLALRTGDRLARRRMHLLLGVRAGEHVEHDNRRLRTWRRFLLLVGILCLVVALARPQWGAHEVVVSERGTDIVLALDISNSMLAEDVSPSRLGLAKSELVSFLGGLRQGRVGLVMFAGAAFVQCPLTLDYETARQFLRQASPDMITAQGTAVAAALASARDLLERGGGAGAQAKRAIILVTDGEDLEGGWQEEAQRCRDAGIVVVAIGLGEPTGGLIPVVDPQGRPAGFLKDESGNVVMSRCDPVLLSKLAETTGGTFVRLGVGGLDRTRLQAMLARLGERELEQRRIAAYEERFMWPLALAFLCLALRAVVRPWRARRAGAPWSQGVGAAGVFLLALSASLSAGVAAGAPLRPDGAAQVDRGRELYAQQKYEDALREFEAARALRPDDARLTNAVGAALFQLGRKEEASREFQRAVAQAKTDELRAESLYHAGTARLALDDGAEAARLLRESLSLDPGRLDARRNLELAMLSLEQRQQQGQDERERSTGDQQEQQAQQDRATAADQEAGDQRPPTSPRPEQQQEQSQQSAVQESAAQEDQVAAGEESIDQNAGDMTRERALEVLRALDHDEAELRRSIQRRLRGGDPRSGKQW